MVKKDGLLLFVILGLVIIFGLYCAWGKDKPHKEKFDNTTKVIKNKDNSGFELIENNEEDAFEIIDREEELLPDSWMDEPQQETIINF